jgi:hypothetical protein
MPERYSMHSPANLSSTDTAMPGNATYLKSLQTGLFCRLASITTLRAQSAVASSTTASTVRLSSIVPRSCATQGVLCDQPTTSTATLLTFTGTHSARLAGNRSGPWPHARWPGLLTSC